MGPYQINTFFTMHLDCDMTPHLHPLTPQNWILLPPWPALACTSTVEGCLDFGFPDPEALDFPWGSSLVDSPSISGWEGPCHSHPTLSLKRWGNSSKLSFLHKYDPTHGIYDIEWVVSHHEMVLGLWQWVVLKLDGDWMVLCFPCLLFEMFLVSSFVCNTKRPSVKQSIKQQVCSNIQMSCTLRWADPPCETVSDSRSSLCWSTSSMITHSKWLAELGEVFRWGVPSDELTAHMKLSVTADQVFTHLCLQWEPIWNSWLYL